MANERILVIEDDPSIRELLAMILRLRGFGAVVAARGESGLEEAAQKRPDLILLDLMLPDMDGLEVCRRLKSAPETAGIPIMMLTARGEESDIVAGLELGAVDYIVKPFNNQTLIARVRAQLRRSEELLAADGDERVEKDGLILNRTERSVTLDGRVVALTTSEFELLLLFIRRPGAVWSRSDIALELRGDDLMAQDRAIDVQIANLRKKLGDWGSRIETVRGVGYRLKRD